MQLSPNQATDPAQYVGRFAPSPTGPLHLGSLVTAMASYLDARQASGKWLLRIEDIDGPREVAGASQQIIADLTALGFKWDGEISYQSERSNHYENSLAALNEHTFKCICSRTDQTADIYDGRCRLGGNVSAGKSAQNKPFAIRLKTESTVIWHDRSGTTATENLTRDCGDFVIRRRDGLWAYQLAVVVDDALQGITHVVRGDDLRSSTARQLWIQKLLGFTHPQYWHVPLVLASDGAKLSKQNGATALETNSENARVFELKRAWKYLSTVPVQASTVDEFWQNSIKLFCRRQEALPPVWHYG